jgi:hypothetical protein
LPDDLETCEVPGPDVPVGADLTNDEEIADYIEFTRPIVLAARAAKGI